MYCKNRKSKFKNKGINRRENARIPFMIFIAEPQLNPLRKAATFAVIV